MFRRRKTQEQQPQQRPPAVVPIMDTDAMVDAIRRSAGGNAMAMLMYTEERFEIVSGGWSVLVEDDGVVSYWVGDRLVALMGMDGEPSLVPSLVSLRTNYSYPLETLTIEMLVEAG